MSRKERRFRNERTHATELPPIHEMTEEESNADQLKQAELNEIRINRLAIGLDHVSGHLISIALQENPDTKKLNAVQTQGRVINGLIRSCEKLETMYRGLRIRREDQRIAKRFAAKEAVRAKEKAKAETAGNFEPHKAAPIFRDEHELMHVVGALGTVVDQAEKNMSGLKQALQSGASLSSGPPIRR